MRSYAPAAPPTAYPDRPDVRMFLGHVLTVADAEIRKLRRDPAELLTRAVQPVLWLVIFGQVMARIRGVPTGRLDYLDFMAPGILAQSVLFIAIFYGISAIWERDLGVLHKYLVSPASRTAALVLGKALSAGVRALVQGVFVYGLALVMRIHMNFAPANILGVLVLVVIGAALFATVSLIIACVVRSRRFMGIGQVITMPLFFASNAIYPLVLMPGWLQAVSSMNPLTYEVDGLRALMVGGGSSVFGLGVNFGVLLVVTAVLIVAAARLYPRLVT